MTHPTNPPEGILFDQNFNMDALPTDRGAHVGEHEDGSETGRRIVVEVVAPPLSTIAMTRLVEQTEIASLGSAPAPVKGPSPGMLANMSTAAKAGIVRKVLEKPPETDPWGIDKIRRQLRNSVMSRQQGTWMTAAEVVSDVIWTFRRQHDMPLDHATDAYRAQVEAILDETDGMDRNKRYPKIVRLLSPGVKGAERDRSLRRLGDELQTLQANAKALVTALAAESGAVYREDQLLALRGTVEPHLSFKGNNSRYNGVLSVILQSDPRVEVAVDDLGKRTFTLLSAPA